MENEMGGCHCCAASQTTSATSEILEFGDANLAQHIPSGAVIEGVHVWTRVKRAGGEAMFAEVKLAGPGGRSEPRVGSSTLADEFENVFLGGPTDLWGRSWTADELRDPTFGVQVNMRASVTCNRLLQEHTCASRRATVLVDVARVQVHYQLCE